MNKKGIVGESDVNGIHDGNVAVACRREETERCITLKYSPRPIMAPSGVSIFS